jgi:hypothetical protein
MSEQPDWTDNPFGSKDGAAEKPFEDPSVQAAQETVPEYNPFEGGAPQSAVSEVQAAPQPEVAAPSWASTGEAGTTAAAVTTAAADVSQQGAKAAKATEAAAKKEAAKAKKLADKLSKEERKRLEQYDKHVAEGGDPRFRDPNYRPANWPPFPKRCFFPFTTVCVPCFHHDFKGEIPDWGYKTLKRLYYTWVAFFILLFYNFLACLALLGCGSDKDDVDICKDTDASAGLSALYFIVAAPLAYLCWFQPIYQGMRKDSSLRFAWFFLLFGLQFAEAVFFTVGAQGTGAAGIMTAPKAYKGDAGIGIMVYVGFGGWATYAIWCAYMLSQVMMVYRSSGQSLQKAQGEAIVGAAKASV